MAKVNPRLKNLKGTYLFPEIEKRKSAFLEKNNHQHLINLGIGDTTTPLPKSIIDALCKASIEMGEQEHYLGYGPSLGLFSLREKISQVIYKGNVSPDEIIISDGCKPDIARVLLLFGQDAKVGVQDLAYPVYVDASVILGQAGPFDEEKGQYKRLQYIPCPEENSFVPNFESIPPLDVISIISPNNPTGVVYTHADLKKIIAYARDTQAVILFDAAYGSYIKDSHLPSSIFSVDGSRHTSIELGSFSKMAGFSGLRLGWTVIPKELVWSDGTSIKKDFERIMTTCFNGASLIVQKAGIAALEDEGFQELALIREGYLKSASLLKDVLSASGFICYGGLNAPYVFAKKEGASSWELFDYFLNQGAIVTTPGSGFGRAGEGFLRFSAFALRDDILKAVDRIQTLF